MAGLLLATLLTLTGSTAPGASHATAGFHAIAGQVRPTAVAPTGAVLGAKTIGLGLTGFVSAYAAPHRELFVPLGFPTAVVVLNTTTNLRTYINYNFTGPAAAVYDPVRDRVYVSDSGNNSVDILSAAAPSHVTSFAGSMATGPIAYDPGTDMIFATAPAGGIESIDPASRLVGVTYVSGAISVNAVAVDNATGFVYFLVSTNSGTYLYAFDEITSVLVNDTAVPAAQFLTIDPGAGLIVVANQTTVSYWDATSQDDSGIAGEVFNLTLPSFQGSVTGLSYDPLDSSVYVGRSSALDIVSAMGASPVILTSVAAPGGPTTATYDPDNQNLYVSQSNNMLVIGASTATIVGQSAVPTWTNATCCEQAIIYVPTTKTLWVVTPSGVHSVIGVYAAGGSHKLVHSVTVAANAQSLLFDPATGEVIVSAAGVNGFATSQNGSITAVNSTSYHTRVIGNGLWGYSMAYDPVHLVVGVSGTVTNQVTIFDASSYALLANVSVGTMPEGITYDALTQAFVVVNAGSYNLTVIQGTTHVLDRNVTFYCHCRPTGILFDPANGELVVQFANAAGISLLNGHTYKTARLHLMAGLYAGISSSFQSWTTAAYDPADHFVFVLTYNWGTRYGTFFQPVGVLDPRGQAAAVLAVSPYPDYPQGAAYDPITHQMVFSAYTHLTFVGS